MHKMCTYAYHKAHKTVGFSHGATMFSSLAFKKETKQTKNDSCASYFDWTHKDFRDGVSETSRMHEMLLVHITRIDYAIWISHGATTF
jgi:hypothetical protein